MSKFSEAQYLSAIRIDGRSGLLAREEVKVIASVGASIDNLGESNHRVERRMTAITADLKTKDLSTANGNFLQCTAFMRFRGPKALVDSLLGSRSRHCYGRDPQCQQFSGDQRGGNGSCLKGESAYIPYGSTAQATFLTLRDGPR